VEAASATLADGLSTALVHGSVELAARVRAEPGVRRVVLVDWSGNLRSL
jgi:thiamine biosynthesis lipoprotein